VYQNEGPDTEQHETIREKRDINKGEKLLRWKIQKCVGGKFEKEERNRSLGILRLYHIGVRFVQFRAAMLLCCWYVIIIVIKKKKKYYSPLYFECFYFGSVVHIEYRFNLFLKCPPLHTVAAPTAAAAGIVLWTFKCDRQPTV
jgi:hypothetical protein